MKLNPRVLSQPASRSLRLWAIVLIAVVGAYLVSTAWQSVHSTRFDKWTVGDWFISYHGGFSRRGLVGTMLMFLSDSLHVPLRSVLATLLSICYTAMFSALAVALNRIQRLQLLHILLVISPFAFIWPSWHGIASHRKEVLLLALASMIPLLDSADLTRLSRVVTWSAYFAALVLSHDGLLFFLPSLTFCLWIRSGSSFQVRSTIPILWIPAIAATAVTFGLTPSANLNNIVDSITQRTYGTWSTSPQIEAGAIASLHGTIAESLKLVGKNLSSGSTLLQVAFAMLAILPLLVCLRTQMRSAAVRNVSWGVIALVPVCLLALIACDWTRWLYILSAILTVAMLCSVQTQSSPIDNSG